MPEPTTDLAPKFTSTEVLAGHGNVDIRGVGTDAERQLQRGKDLARMVREKTAAEGAVGERGGRFKKALLLEPEGPPPLATNEKGIAEMRARFGAGEAKKDATGALLEPTEADANAIFKEGNSQIDKLTGFLKYADVTDAIKRGKPAPDVLKEKGITNAAGDADFGKYDKLREDSLDLICKNEKFMDQFPFLKSLRSDADIRVAVEGMLATDPALQKKIMDKMNALGDQVNLLPDVKAANGVSKKQSRENRLTAERDIVDGLGNVMIESVAEVLDDREMALEQVQKEQWSKETDDGLKKVTNAMDSRWISYDQETRKRKIDTKQIGKDVRLLAYEGEQGVKRLMIRELGLELKDEHGNPLLDADGDTVDWKNVDISQLSGNEKAMLEKSMGKYGDEFRNKLLKDFGKARTVEKTITGKPDKNLRLYEWEWGKLHGNCEKQIESALKVNPDADKIMQKVAESGIDKDKDKEGWLAFLIILLGGLVSGVSKGVKETLKGSKAV